MQGAVKPGNELQTDCRLFWRFSKGGPGLCSVVEDIVAVHDFLRFQITEHKTGDALEAK
jgi:hypothetical protein